MGLRREHVLNCMFSSWYHKFQHVTIKSYVLPLPDEFVRYLQEDGPLVLPKGAQIGSHVPDEVETQEDSQQDNKDPEEIMPPEFPELIQQIEETLQNLNRKVFPKLNWSSPKDASWITASNTLKCSTPGEIILLLKSSDFISYDLTSPFKLCDDSSGEDPPFQRELVLRKWGNLVPGMEFRCFVRNKKLIAACQRHHRQYYEYVEAQKEIVTVEICRFLQENILREFPNENYVVDIYKKRNGGYWVIDFNPWGAMTDPLLFTWEELEALEPSRLALVDSPIITPDGEVIGEFRFVKKDSTMQPSEALSYRMPQDFLDLSTGADATKLVDFLRLIQDGTESDSDDDEPWGLPNLAAS